MKVPRPAATVPTIPTRDDARAPVLPIPQPSRRIFDDLAPDASYAVPPNKDRDSFSVTALADLTDRSLHAVEACFTAGLSPAALAEAYLDWATHLANAPGKRMQLVDKAMRKAVRFANYATRCAMAGGKAEHCIEPLPQDRRFAGDDWHRWPFNFIQFDSNAAQRLAALGDPVILVRTDTNTADVTGFAASAGILTAAGGRTAHAALVARHVGKLCVVGCRTLSVDGDGQSARLADKTIAEGDWISIDGGSGEIFLGQRDIVTELPEAELTELKRWRASGALKQSA